MATRKIFTVMVNGKEYDVWDVEGKEHEGYNDTPKSWWLYYSERLPDGIQPPPDSEYWHPMQSSIERSCWEYKFSQRTYTKVKWDELRFSGTTKCEMWRNGKLVYAFSTTGGTRGMAFAMAKAQYLEVILSEHCYNFFEPEKENGRKIFWYGLPATVRVKSDGWEISIIPDYTAGLDKDAWWDELSRRESKINNVKEEDDMEEMIEESKKESRSDGYINWGDALSDGNINWFRK